MKSVHAPGADHRTQMQWIKWKQNVAKYWKYMSTCHIECYRWKNNFKIRACNKETNIYPPLLFVRYEMYLIQNFIKA